MVITEKQWKLINDIALSIHGIDDITEMRRTFLTVFRALIPFDSASFYVQEGENPYGSPLGINLTEEDLRRYIEHYSKIDPFAPLLEMMADSQSVIRTSDYITMGDIEETEYFKSVLAMKKIRYSVMIPLVINGDWMGCISLFRHEDKYDFTETELEMAAILKKHLQTRLRREKYFAEKAVSAAPETNHAALDAEQVKEYNLTDRECEVIELTSKGLTDDEICEAMSISRNTLKKHISNIYSKLAISSRVGLLKVMSKK